MQKITRIVAGTAFAGSLFLTAGMGAANAAPNQTQDGLVNVAVGDVTVLQDVNVGVAANVVAQVCGLKVGPVAALARQVDRSGATTTVCTSPSGPVVISQN
jgi:hypothetical protein